MRTRVVVAATMLAGGAVFGATAARASQTIVKIPAPPAVASGSAVNIGHILTVGDTGAAAGSNGAAAGAVPVSVLGHPVIGGAQVGPGAKSGALVDTGATPLGRLQVAPFATQVTQSATSRQANASSAAARADVLNPDVIHVDVLQSASSATYTDQLSSGHAFSDGAVIRIGGPSGTVIRILHSEADANGQGRSYLLAVGDNVIIDNDIVGAACALDLAPALNVACLQVAGGVGGLTASVLQAAVGGVNGLTAGVITSAGTGGVGNSVDTARVFGETVVRAPGGASNPLARTGQNVGLMILLAIALLAMGAVTLATTKVAALLPVRVTR